MATGSIKNFMVNIPTKPYLKKYLVAKYGAPIPLTHQTLIGSAVLGFLSKEVPADTKKMDTDLRFKHFTKQVWFTLPQHHVNKGRHGLNISDPQIISLNRYFENEFEESMFHCCNYIQLASSTIQRKQALEIFVGRFGIEIDEDITMDCLIKTDYRTRKNFPTISPVFVLSEFRA